MLAGRPPTAGLLALLYGAGGVLCLVGAVTPMNERTPVTLLTVLGLVGLGGCATLWALGPRLGPAATHAAVAVITALIGLLAWRSVTAIGIVGLGPAMLAVSAYVGHFLARTAARLHVLVLVTVASAGAWAAAPSGFLVAWLSLLVTVALLAEILAWLAEALRAAAGTDPLTGVANRRAWEDAADRHLARAARTGEPVTVALLDLDDFKLVNDSQGHGAGDLLLRELTAAWRGRLRRPDVLGRYGGDEFVLCLPATDEVGAATLLEQLAASHHSSWSTGVATARRGDTLTAVLARADAALYATKRARRASAAAALGAPPGQRVEPADCPPIAQQSSSRARAGNESGQAEEVALSGQLVGPRLAHPVE